METSEVVLFKLKGRRHMMKKTALLVAIVAVAASAAVSQVEARSRHSRSEASAQAAGFSVLPPGVAGANAFVPRDDYGPAYNAPTYNAPTYDSIGRPGENGPAHDTYNHYGPAGQLLQRSYPG